MPILTIKGIPIDFPFEPYPCQVDYMTRVIEALENGRNALLESPTGTGKTLCLLCATLAWRKAYVERMKLEQFTKTQGRAEADADDPSWDSLEATTGPALPKILFCSRTHSQLSQCINELKNTSYNPKVTVLGSRDQLCVHPDVRKAEGHSAKTRLCRQKTKARKCRFYNNLETKRVLRDQAKKEGEVSGIMDIEDIVEFGKRYDTCPFYLSRHDHASAEIVFMPYNYLIDPASRRSQHISLENNVVILDEAHNIESICEGSASFDLTSTNIAAFVEDINRLLDIVSDQEEGGGGGGGGTNPALDLSTPMPSKSDLALLKKLLLRLETLIDEVDMGKEGVAKPGTFIYELFSQCNIKFSTVEVVLATTEIACDALVGLARGSGRCALTKFVEILRMLFGEAAQANIDEIDNYYCTYISNEVQQQSRKKNQGWNNMSEMKRFKGGRSLGFWCFSPGFAMKDLVRCKTRSIVLTSGTLSPLDSFATELMIDFPIRLENPHVIAQKQMWVGVVGAGPTGKDLISTFAQRDTAEYKTELGNAIVNYARTVPKGLLVFFPSYTVLRNCISAWQTPQSDGRCLWDRILQYKVGVVEPRDKQEFVAAMDTFYSSISPEEAQSGAAGGRPPAFAVSSETVSSSSATGAVFFAVSRGKVSEGLDFADDNGRAVVITGLPYPSLYDPKVKQKRFFMDKARARNRGRGLTGNAWYQLQASRAVNQAIGRVIRHRRDYGAIILCDARFRTKDNIAQLPKWVRPYVQVCSSFGEAQGMLTRFFRTVALDPTLVHRNLKQRRVRRPDAKGQHSTSGVDGLHAVGWGHASSSDDDDDDDDDRHEDGRGDKGSRDDQNIQGVERRRRKRLDKRSIAYEQQQGGSEQLQVRADAGRATSADRPSLMETLNSSKPAHHRVDAEYRGVTPALNLAGHGSNGEGDIAIETTSSVPPQPVDAPTAGTAAFPQRGSWRDAPVVKRPKRSLYVADIEQEQSGTASAATASADLKQNVKSRFNTFIAKFRAAISKPKFRNFTALIKKFKEDKQSMTTSEAAAVLVDRLCTTLLDELEINQRNQLLLELASALPATVQDEYLAAANAAIALTPSVSVQGRVDDTRQVDAPTSTRPDAHPSSSRASDSASIDRPLSAAQPVQSALPPSDQTGPCAGQVASSEQTPQSGNMAAKQPTKDVASLQELKLCSICGSKWDKPFRARCGHVACFLCWRTLLTKAATTKTASGKKQPASCPACGSRVRKGDLTKMFLQ